MDAIVAVDNNWAIGYQGDLLVSIPEDQRDVFRKYTIGHSVILGRKTLDTFPGRKLLPGRKHIIMSRNENLKIEDADVCHSVHELSTYVKNHPDQIYYVIGGEQIYQLLLPYCRRAIVTHIDATFDADAYFPDLNEKQNWKLLKSESEIKSKIGLAFNVSIYENNEVLRF